MNLNEAITQLLTDTKGVGGVFDIAENSSLWFFRPELVLCVTIVLLLLVRLSKTAERFTSPFGIMLAGSSLAFWLALDGDAQRVEIFTGMLIYDGLSVFIRSFLMLFLILFTLFTRLSGIPNHKDGQDTYVLVLGATLGMCLMASANHLLMVFLSVEMASVPSYALAATLKGRKVGSEAALKYAVYGAGAAGIMLYGISLLCGLTNSAHLPTVAASLAERLPAMSGQETAVLSLAALLILVGLAFKLSAVPFHFWCPDVFAGAPAEIGAFLSVASKAGALALLLRVAIGFGYLPAPAATPESLAAHETAAVVMNSGAMNSGAMNSGGPIDDVLKSGSGAFFVSDVAENAEHHQVKQQHGAAETDRAALNAALAPARNMMAKLIAFLAIITCTFGNLAAYGQTNMKRLFAYSTIAHAGYMMMAVPAVLALSTIDPQGAEKAVAALLIYVGIYLLMNLGAFAVIAFMRNAMRSEEIKDYAGLIRRCPGLAICFSVILFSLVGLPPLAGFVGKFAIFAALADGYTTTLEAGAAANYLLLLLIVGGLNAALSLFYYLRVIKVMTIDPEPEDRPPFEFSMLSLQGGFVAALALPLLALGVFWSGLSNLALEAARHLLT